MNDRWYYFANGAQAGPVPLSRIRELVLDGMLSRSAEVWKQGTPDWVPLSKVTELHDLFAPPPPALAPQPASAVPPAPARAITQAIVDRVISAYTRPKEPLVHSPPLAGAVAAAIFYLAVAVVLIACFLWLGRSGAPGIYSAGLILGLLVLIPLAATRLWRTAFEIDAEDNVIVRQGPLVTPFEARYSGRDFRAVAIIPRLRTRSQGRPEISYLVELRGARQAVQIACEQFSSAALGLAEDVAIRLQLDLIDGSENPPVLRRTWTLTQNLRETGGLFAEASASSVLFPPISAHLQSLVQLDRNRATLRLPVSGYGCLATWLIFAAAGIGLVVHIGFQTGHGGLIAMWSAFVGFPLLAGLALAAPTQTTVEANTDFIRLKTTAFGISSEQEIPTFGIREIRRDFKFISIRTRERSFGFACRGMSEGDAETVRDILTLLARWRA
ncbi:MAG: DUF4339 domain-containing protein [Gemmataceae bacterium]|nr:DUF4339 domain-containing protein [Gemmataceae bacterium]